MTLRPPMWLLIMISAVGPFSLNAFIPSLPRLAETFATDYGTAQLALTLFLVGIGVGQLIYGPLSDRYGRRPVLLAGLGLGFAGSIVCLLAPTIEVLLFGRVAQALGSCAGLVLARAMVRDLYSRDQSASTLGYVTMGMAMMPMVAPGIGGLLDQSYGWRASFWAMIAFGGFAFFAARARAYETNHSPLSHIDFTTLTRGWIALMRSHAFLGYTLAISFNSIQFFGFLAAAPYLMVGVLDRPPAEYGLWFAFCAIAYACGNFIAGRWSAKVGLDRLAAYGLYAALLPCVLLVALHVTQGLTPLGIFGPFFLIGFSNGATQPNLIAGAVSVNPVLAGSASGLLGFTQMAMGAVATVVMGHSQDGSLLPMAVLFFFCSIGAIASHRLAMHRHTG